MKRASPTSASKATAIRWRILLILALASFVSYVLRTNLSFAAPEMMADLGLSEIQWGYVLAAFTAGYAIFQFPGGVLGDRFGPRRVLTVIAVGWALLTLVTALVPGREAFSTTLIIAALFGVRFLVGAVHAPIFPVMNASIVRWFPVGGWALPLGLASTGLTLGGAAAAIAVPLVIAGFGWRIAFLALAPLGLLIAVAWWWYSRDEPADHPAVDPAELELIRGRQRAGNTGEPDEPLAWLRVLKNRDVLMLMLSYSSMNFVFYIVFNWFFYYLVEVREFAATDAGFISSAQWIAGAAGAALGGWLCDRLCGRLGLRWGCRWPVIIGMAASAALLLVGAFHGTPAVAVTALVLCFFFNQLNEGPYWATSVAVGGRHAGAAGGVMNTGANVMGIVNALLVPLLAARLGWTAAIASGAAFAVLGILFMLLVRADRTVD
ncbi:MAG: MFS transporter [Xanthomonadales bacterium]|nr:MFS transporter [Xanthomonadales bacterium]NNK37768.1 MFS transporter [Xanthomonadales bacterium]